MSQRVDDSLVGQSRAKIPLELESLFECEDVLRYLASSHTIFAKKVGLSGYIARYLANVLKADGLVRSIQRVSVSDLPAMDRLDQCDGPSILLIDSSTPDENLNDGVLLALSLVEGTETVVWLVSFLSLMDRRVLARFRGFFAFSSSTTELDILSDVLPVSRRDVDALERAHDAVFFFAGHTLESQDLLPTNPCLLKLPKQISTGVTQWPSVVAVDRLYKELPTGRLFYYYTRDHVPLLRYQLANYTLETHTVELTCWVGKHPKQKKTKKITPGRRASVYQSPVFEDEGTRIEAIRDAELRADIRFLRDGETSETTSHSFPIKLLPWNVLRWAIREGGVGQDYQDLTHHIAAFVTPKVEEVEEVYQRAKALAADLGDATWLPGTQYENPAEALPKIEAIYRALRERPLKYDSRPVLYGPDDIWGYQEVRSPRQTLTKNSGNCVDFSVLFASLLERAHVLPLIVIQSKHVFVGWKIERSPVEEETTGLADFLDPMYVTGYEFEIALNAGRGRYRRLQRDRWFDRNLYDIQGFSRLIDIEQHRGGDQAILYLEP